MAKYRVWTAQLIDADLDSAAKALRERNRDRQGPILEPDFDPVPTAVQIGRCAYSAPCRAPRCRASCSSRPMIAMNATTSPNMIAASSRAGLLMFSAPYA